jgi:hypothetical protein
MQEIPLLQPTTVSDRCRKTVVIAKPRRDALAKPERTMTNRIIARIKLCVRGLRACWLLRSDNLDASAGRLAGTK